ncbi:MAG TPA: hypothetical protein VIM71_16115 [Lacunisphaera sp.]
MKTTTPRSLAGILLLALGLAGSVSATPITGSIAFNGTPNFDDSPLSNATGITGYDFAYTAFIQQTGDYASLPNFLPVTFYPFIFSPPDQSVVPLWSFSHAGLTYSASITSMVSNFNAALNIWNFGGSGILSITGFEDTAAAWNFSTGQIGNAYFFGSAWAAIGNPPSVPDSGGTLLMVALGLACMTFVSQSTLTQTGKKVRRQLPQLSG